MKSSLGRAAAIAASTAVVLALSPTAAFSHGYDVDQVLPYAGTKSLDVGAFGQVLVATNPGDGSPVRVRAVWPGGSINTVATFPGGSTVGAASSQAHVFWVLYAADDPNHPSTLWRKGRWGPPAQVADIAAFQAANPDPYDQDGDATASNPYDLEAMRDGSALVADAQHNSLVRVWPSGNIRTVACFPAQPVSTAGVPIPDLPPTMVAESVPTGVSIGPDGWAYVSELRGFPFAPGSSRVWRVNPNAHQVGCNGSADDVRLPGRVVARGFNGINDLTVGRDGSLYVLELNKHGVLAAEEAFTDPSTQQGMGRLTRIAPSGHRFRIASGELSFPGGVAVTGAGKAYVTDMFLFGGPLLRIHH